MRPLALEIEGFTAFRERQAVDFSDLDLFVITGPTGSGKTSVLDAMIFALYGKVPRAGTQTVRDLVSHGIAESRVRLEFEVAGERYQIARRLPRSGAQSATLERAEGEDWRSAVEGAGVRVVNEAIERLLKLPFEAFTRAVVLPQGEFHRFLRGERDARREILSRLLGLGHFAEMGARARARASEARTKIANTEAILAEQFADVTEAEHDRLVTAASEAAAREAKLDVGLRQVEAFALERAELNTSRKAIEQGATDVGSIAAELDELADARASASKVADQAVRELEEAKRAFDSAQNEADKARATLAEAIADAGSLEEITRIESALERWRDSDAERERLVSRHGELTAENEALVADVATAEAAVDEALSDELAARSAADTAESEAATLRSQADRVKEQRASIDDAERRRAAAESSRAREDGNATATQAKLLTVDERLAALDGEVAELRRTHAAAAAAQGLERGMSCPICHRPLEDHPDVGGPGPEELEKARIAAEEVAAEKRKLEIQMATASEACRAATNEAEHASQEIADALAGETLEDLREAADSLVAATATAVEESERAARARDAARDSLTEAEKQLAERKGARDGCARLITEVATAIDREGKEAAVSRSLVETHFRQQLPEDPAAEIMGQRRVIEAATADCEAQAKALEEARTARERVSGQAADARDQVREVDARVTVLAARYTTSVDRVGGAIAALNEDATLPPIGDIDDLQRLRDSCVGVRAVLGEITARVDTREERLVEGMSAVIAENELDGDADPLVVIRDALSAATRESGAARQAVENLTSQLEKRANLEAQIGDHRDRVALFDSLATELRNDRFVGFILQETFDLLALRASEELRRISDDRYSLVSSSGEFEVVDHANADETRGVNTLSGGETFLASLSLALALSGHVGDLVAEGIGAKLQAVFIDEGFGTLDPETLDDVVDALERLREGNLLVGVISHVPVLAQRLRTGVRVEKVSGWSRILQDDVL